MRRLLTTRCSLAIIAGLVSLLIASPSLVAADGGSGVCAGSTCTVTVTTGGTVGGSDGLGSGSSSDCTFIYESMPADAITVLGPGGPQPGAWYYVTEFCQGAPEQGPFYVWVPTGTGPAPPEVVARQAMAQLHLVAPAVGLSPARGVPQVTGLPMWLWVDSSQWHGLTATASVGGVSATVTATPSQTVWNPGDGSSPLTCNGPGTPYNFSIPESAQHTDCSYTYQRSAHSYNLRSTIVWHVTWSAVGAPGGGDFGFLRGGQTVIPVCVTEIHALNGDAPPAGNPCA